MADYDAREEQEVFASQARKDKLAAAEEDGWTVVVGNKGRKKTTDSESVGAVSTAAAAEKATKQSKKEVVMDFYRFQRRESRRNEVLELQQKFGEDKKRTAKFRRLKDSDPTNVLRELKSCLRESISGAGWRFY